MSKKFNSRDEIKNHFSIESDDLSIIRDELNSKRAKIHPDKTKGKFESDTTEEEYHSINNAIEFIDSLKENQSLVVVERMTDLMKVMTDLIPNNKHNSLEQSLDTKISFTITSFRSRMFLPKISLTAITAIVTFLFLFPNQIKDNPTLSYYINPTSTVFALLWFILLSYSIMFWILVFFNEEKAKKALALLKVDSVQNRIFEQFIEYLDDNKSFTKDDLTNFIYNIRNHERRYKERSEVLNIKPVFLFGSKMITEEIAQNIAELIISRGEKNDVIKKLSRNTLSDTYELKNYR